jgi:hypothetical protein
VALVSIESWIAQPEYNKIYMADTSFLIKSTICLNKELDYHASDDHKLLKQFKQKLIQTGCTIFYNATARGELLHVLRRVLITASIKEGKVGERELSRNFLKECTQFDINKDFNRLIKHLLSKGYVNFFNDLFGETGEYLNQEFNYCTSACKYISFNGSLSWDDAVETMAQYALDSSDAMIINAAVNIADCVGLITGDQDYKYCYDISQFDIIFPGRFGNSKPKSFDSFEAEETTT